MNSSLGQESTRELHSPDRGVHKAEFYFSFWQRISIQWGFLEHSPHSWELDGDLGI